MRLLSKFYGVSFLLGVMAVNAQEHTVTFETIIASKYIDRGIQLADDVVHASVEFSQSDFYAGMISALPLENEGFPGFFEDEFKYYAGYGWALDDRTVLDIGGTYSHYPRTGSDDTFEVYVGISREMGTFTPSLNLTSDFDSDTHMLELATDIALPLEIIPVEASFFVGRVETRGDEDYTYYGADFIYPVEINDSTKLSFGLHYADHDLGLGLPDNHLYGTASIAVTF